jgi:protein-ribulosamine 3-kinase
MLEKLEEMLGVRIISTSNIGGGSIANSQLIKTERGVNYFLKSYGSNKEILKSEANGLEELAKTEAIRIPKVVAVTNDFLILEYIHTGKRNNNFSEIFGRKFAQMHRTTSEQFGFFENNFIGSNPQINVNRSNCWIEFFWENRLLFQFRLAERNGYVDNDFHKLFNKLETQVPLILSGTEEPPTILHGDLWSGNFMVDEIGIPVLIDPAVYYGNRESDLAMTQMFGGFDSKFYSAYNEIYPLCDDWEYRMDLYMLSHVNNHLNLFGTSYYNQAISIIKKYT